MPSLVNWNDEIKYDVPEELFKTPKSITDVQKVIKAASEHGQQVRVIGAMHSTTECMVGTGITISMTSMTEILSIDRKNLTVTVQGGVTLHQLCGELKKVGLQPPVILEWGNFQIGAISGTHANDTSLRRGAQFSSYVVGIKLVTPTGDIMEISEIQNSEYLPAIRSHFGLFGVVCEVTVKIFETKPLQVGFQVFELGPFISDFEGHLQTLKNTYDQTFGMLFTNTGKLLVQCRKFVEPGTPSPHPLTGPLESKEINLFADLVLPIARAGTSLHMPAPNAELLNSALVDLPLKLLRHSAYIINPCDRGILYAPDDPDFEFYDWVFPEEKWPEMARAFLQLCKRFEQEHNFFLTLPALVYFIKQDQGSLLSRSRKANMMAIDPEYPDPNEPMWKTFRLAFSEVSMRHGGIPHINKTRDGAIYNFAKACDQDALHQYLQMRKKMDPKGMFLNPYFKTLFEGYL